jgi:thiopeptide-type bacteriocin biosynthesis protein
MTKSATQQFLYQAMDFAIVRTPLLPVEAFLGLHSPEAQHALLQDPRVRKAVAVGSVSLFHALHKLESGDLTRKDEERAMAKLLRYQIRMSTRPTPYGLFAGCAAVPFAGKTDLAVRTTFAHSRTRPDMAWLMNFVAEAESNPIIRKKLRLIANPLIQVEGGRLSLSARMPGHKDEKSQPVSVRATRVVTEALELAKTWIGHADLFASLQHAHPSAPPEKVEQLLDELQEQTILLTDLRPPLTSLSPAQYVLDRLRQIPEASEAAEKLQAFLQAACRWDRAQEIDREFSAFLKAIDCPEDGSKDLPCQVDMAIAVDGAVGSIVALEAARAAQLLLRLSPSPGGLSSLAAYRNAFVSRYGHERELPLMELLDPARGLGPPSAHGTAYTGPEQATAARRNRTLLNLACAALHQRQSVLMLDETTLSNLETSAVRSENAPVSLDINLMIAAKSAAAVDNGEFTVVVGPNLGGWAACRNFARFAHLYSAEKGSALLERCAAREEANHFQGHLWAEIVYLPWNVRSANVAVRPAIRSHELLFGVASGVPEESVFALDDLVVGVADNRFYVRSQRERKRIRFVSGHMLNHHGAPAVVQFLLDVSYDGLITFNSFDWGPAQAFPFLPRVQVERIVLRPAEWRLTKDRLATQSVEAFRDWREDWNVPRYVCLTFGDNRLLLDLECPAHVKQILKEVTKLPEGHPLQLQEVLPALDDAWLQGSERHYYSEFVVPLVLRPFDRERRTRNQAEAVQTDRPAVTQFPTAADLEQRSRPPGSDWLFAKLYCPASREDELIAERLLPMAENSLAAGLADSWFFIRYADPEGHIRLRFHGDPERLSTHLFSQTSQWAQAMIDDGICKRLVFDTYDRELERFGGIDGMALAESIFHADSRFAATLVKVLRSKEWEDGDLRMVLFALSVDDLFRIIGFTAVESLDWYKSQKSENDREAGTEYRRLKTHLRRAIGDSTSWLSDTPFGSAINAAFVRRAEDLSAASTRLLHLVREQKISISVEKLFASYAHLHLNRIGAARAERMLLNLLFRTRASLANAPVRGRSPAFGIEQ